MPLQFPWLSDDIAEPIGLTSKVIVMPVSLVPKPEPVTVTTVPGGPLLGLMARVRFGTVKVTLGTKPDRVTGP